MEKVSSIVVLVIAVFLVRALRAGNLAVSEDPSVTLRSNERFRTLRMQQLEPALAIVVVGSLLVTDLQRTPLHLLLAVVGGAAGYAFGVYRARSTFVASVPAHRGLILRYSIESFLALGLLLVVKLVAELNLLPEGEVFRSLVSALLGFLLVESCARVITLVRYYRRDENANTMANAADA